MSSSSLEERYLVPQGHQTTIFQSRNLYQQHQQIQIHRHQTSSTSPGPGPFITRDPQSLLVITRAVTPAAPVAQTSSSSLVPRPLLAKATIMSHTKDPQPSLSSFQVLTHLSQVDNSQQVMKNNTTITFLPKPCAASVGAENGDPKWTSNLRKSLLSNSKQPCSISSRTLNINHGITTSNSS